MIGRSKYSKTKITNGISKNGMYDQQRQKSSPFGVLDSKSGVHKTASLKKLKKSQKKKLNKDDSSKVKVKPKVKKIDKLKKK
jgi:hypothetical protein